MVLGKYVIIFYLVGTPHDIRNICIYLINIVSVITQQVLGLLPIQILSGYPYNVEELESDPCRYRWEIAPFAEPRRKRSRSYYPYYVNNNDVSNIFRVRYTTSPFSYFRGVSVSRVSLYTFHLTHSNIL